MFSYHRGLLVVFVVLLMCAASTSRASAPAGVDAAIVRALDFLRRSGSPPHVAGLVAYAQAKGSHKIDTPEIKANISIVLSKFSDTGYRPTQHHFYEAAIDAMALEAVDPALYLPQLQQIADYIIAGQLTSGGWYYEGQDFPGGDTSITQYSVLGLWAASRAGVAIPASVWDRVGRWHLQTQRPDGGHEYQPTRGGQSTLTMTGAGCGSLSIINRELFNAGSLYEKQNRKKYGILKQVDLDRAGEASPDGPVSLNTSQLDAGAKRAFNWISSRHNFTGSNYSREWQYYYLYTVERFCSLNNIKEINGLDWYEEGAANLIKTQAEDGSWMSRESIPDTCFGILFLGQATAQILGTTTQQTLVGGGMLIGGRGLPDDLAGVVIEDGNVKADMPAEGMDAVMRKLANMDLEVLEGETKQLDIPALLKDPMALMANGPVFYQLIEHQDPQIRLQVVNSLISSDRLEACGPLIEKLRDENWGIVAEAHRGLKIISRKPFGVGGSEDPSGFLPEGVVEARATSEQREAARERFYIVVINKWNEWYQQAVPPK